MRFCFLPLIYFLVCVSALVSGVELLQESLSDRDTKIQGLADEIESFSNAKSALDAESTKLRYASGSLLPPNLILDSADYSSL